MIRRSKQARTATPSEDRDLAGLLERRCSLSVILGRKNVRLEHLLRYSEGSVLVLGAAELDSLRLEVEGKEIGRGTAVTVGGRRALRLEEVEPPGSIVTEVFGGKSETDDPK